MKTAVSVGAQTDVEQTGKHNGTREILSKSCNYPLNRDTKYVFVFVVNVVLK